jgi:hypothetical protein
MAPQRVSMTRASPGSSGVARSTAAAAGSSAPWDLEWHTKVEDPDWTATYELLRPYPNQRRRVVYRRGDQPPVS